MMLEKILSRLQQKQSQSGDFDTESVLELNWESLDDPAQKLASLLSLFALAPIPWSLASASANAANLKFDLASERDILVQKYLLQKLTEDTNHLHEQIRGFLSVKREQLDNVECLKHGFCQAMLELAQEIPNILTQEKISKTKLELALPHLSEAATVYKNRFSNKNLISLFIGIIYFYQAQGNHAQASPWFKQYLSVVKDDLIEDHPYTATIYNNQAEFYYFQGQYTEAEPLFQKALSLRQQLLGEDHPDVATSYNNLAGLYYSQGRYAEAELLFQKALSLRQQLLGEDHPDVATSYKNLAELYRSQGRYAEAEPLYQKALALRQQLLGEDHPDVATSYNDLAYLYYFQGRYAEAEPLYQKALALRQQLLGEDHPDVATSYNDLAYLYYSQGKYAEAEPLFQKALLLRQRLLGEEHPDVATSYNNLALIYYSQGKYAEAEPLFQKSLSLRQQLLGEDHPDVATSYNNLALLHYSLQRYTKAEPLFQKTLSLRQQMLAEDDADVATNVATDVATDNQEELELPLEELEIPLAKIAYHPKENTWFLTEKYLYRDNYKDCTIILDEGFSFSLELASIPRFLWRIIGIQELPVESTLIHSFMYMSKGGKKNYHKGKKIKGRIEGGIEETIYYSRKEADDLVTAGMMKQLKAKKHHIILIYIGLRILGIIDWRPNRLENMYQKLNGLAENIT